MSIKSKKIDRGPTASVGSAQSLLLMILGELVWRKQDNVWTSSLITGLATLGVTENGARTAIHRANQKGIIQVRKRGREAQCSIGDFGKRIFLEGARSVYGFHAESPDWDGRWLVVLVTVPESQRDVRHFIKTRLRWTGMGSPTPGIWIAPRINRVAIEMLEELDLKNQIHSYVGKFGPLGDEAAMVLAAWNIAEIELLYRGFISRFESLRASTDRDGFRAYINLIQAWRKFPYIDPQLPRRFLPDPWIGRKAAEFFRERHGQWSAAAMRFWREIQRNDNRNGERG